MSVDAESSARPVRTAPAEIVARVRRISLAVLVLVVVEYGLGMYVNLYVAIPSADHGSSLTSEIANGPVVLTIHAVIGLLLGLAAIGLLVQAIMSRHWGAIALSAVGLIMLGGADLSGVSFTSSGKAIDSMAMSVDTGLALLCYLAMLYFLRSPRQPE
jgi:ABC-type Co2+ transport system permease subunit